MKKFIQSNILFLSFLFFVIFCFVELTERIVYRKSDFKLNIKPIYIVLGNSHPECAFNDSLIDNFSNLSKSGESFFYTYIKAKNIIIQNPSIQVIFIEFSNLQIDGLMNEWTWGEKAINHSCPIYSPFMTLSDESTIAKKNFLHFLSSKILSLKENINRINNNDFNYSKAIGGYQWLERDKTDSLLKIKNYNSNFLSNNNLSEINIHYLNKLIKFCHSKDKKVILIRSPLHQKYAGYSNEISYQKIRQINYSSIDYIDFSKFPLNNSEFGDLEHLNHKGAKKFSIWFSKLLENNLLEKNNYQIIIDNEIEKFKNLHPINSN